MLERIMSSRVLGNPEEEPVTPAGPIAPSIPGWGETGCPNFCTKTQALDLLERAQGASAGFRGPATGLVHACATHAHATAGSGFSSFELRHIVDFTTFIKPKVGLEVTRKGAATHTLISRAAQGRPACPPVPVPFIPGIRYHYLSTRTIVPSAPSLKRHTPASEMSIRSILLRIPAA